VKCCYSFENKLYLFEYSYIIVAEHMLCLLGIIFLTKFLVTSASSELGETFCYLYLRLHKWKPELVSRLLFLEDRLSEIKVNITIAWIPGHQGIQFNDIANRLAKNTA